MTKLRDPHPAFPGLHSRWARDGSVRHQRYRPRTARPQAARYRRQHVYGSPEPVTLAVALHGAAIRARMSLSLWTEPYPSAMEVGNLGKRTRWRRLADRVADPLLVRRKFRQLQRHLRFARRRHRFPDLDVAIDDH